MSIRGAGGGRRDVSRSMVAFVVSVTAALLLGLSNWVPALLRTDDGIARIDPGLFTVAESARGIATLGRGYTVSAYRSGFRVSASSGPLIDTITRGSPVSALTGALTQGSEHPIEVVRSSLDHVRIDEAVIEPGRTAYVGEVFGEVDGAERRMPLRLEFVLTTAGVFVSAFVEGADAVVLHLDATPATRGLTPALPERNLRRNGWWIEERAGEQRAFTSASRAFVGVGPAIRARAVDLRNDGRLDVHVWSDRATLTLSGVPRAG